MWELQEHALKLVESIKIGQKDEKKSKLFYRGELRAKHGFQEAEDLLVLLFSPVRLFVHLSSYHCGCYCSCYRYS